MFSRRAAGLCVLVWLAISCLPVRAAQVQPGEPAATDSSERAEAQKRLVAKDLGVQPGDSQWMEEPGVADPLSLPVQSIASLSQFLPRQTLQHRVKIAGVVTLCEPARSFFLQDAGDGIQVLTPPKTGLRPGDYVMAAGYPVMGALGYELHDAVFRVMRHGALPDPERLEPGHILEPRLQDRWVRVQARLLSRVEVGAREVLTLQLQGHVFEAQCMTRLDPSLSDLPSDSVLELNGVYRMLADEARRPCSFQLRVPSDLQIQVLERPSWWTLGHTSTVVGAMAVIVAATILWVLVLRRKIREQTTSLLQSERKFRSLVEQSLVGVYAVQEGRFAYINPREAEIFGYTPEEMLQCPVEQMVLPEDRPLVRHHIQRRITGQANTTHYSFRGVRKDGSVVYVEVLGTRTEFDGGSAVLGTTMDVTEQKRAERELAEASSLLETLLENSPDYIYFKDLQSRFVRFSKAFEKLFNVPDAAGLRGKTDFDFFLEEHARPAYEDEQEIIRTGKPMIGKLEKEAHPDGRVTWALTTKMPWRDKAGTIIGTFGISKEVTALKEAEAKLELAHQRLVETSRLAGMAEVATDVLHNVGNVLNSVNVSCALTIDRLKVSKVSSLGKVAALLEQNSARLGDFVTADPRGRQIPGYLVTLAAHLAQEQSDLLKEMRTLLGHIDHIKQIVAMQQSYAKVAGVKESVSAGQLAEDALQINAAALARHNVQVRRDFQETPPILTEKHKVLQILVNLIRNAKEAIDASKRPDKRIDVKIGMDGGGRVKIQVIDNGIGISRENLTRIFAHGFTTRADGHGFGLHSSALAARELGGSLQVCSDGPGRGAIFTLLLPCQ
jgi:PAS domain S-box-containing protein